MEIQTAIDRQSLKQAAIKNLQDQTTKYTERLIDRYVCGLNTREETVRFFICKLLELSDSLVSHYHVLKGR